MISHTVRVALLASLLAGACPSSGYAQSSDRLRRPVEASAEGADGKLEVSEKATIGNLTVDQYIALGRRVAGPDANPGVVEAITGIICKKGGPLNSVSAYAVSEAMKGVRKDERALLKARDPATMTALATRAVAVLDGVSADAIRADEAIGPGAYHDAVTGMRTALVACDFFGQRL